LIKGNLYEWNLIPKTYSNCNYNKFKGKVMCPPSSEGYVRDYKAEAKYESTPSQKKKRASRGRARYQALKKGKVRLGDSLELDHKNHNPNDNSSSNLRVTTRSKNRSFPRTKSAGVKLPKNS
jgi:hypothetical protein